MENIIENHEMAMEQSMEEKKISIPRRILRAAMRPFLHVFAELASIGTLGLIATAAAAVVIGAAILATAWAKEIAGIRPDSVQDAVITVSVCGSAVYVFIKEMCRASGKLRAWTDQIHGWIAAA